MLVYQFVLTAAGFLYSREATREKRTCRKNLLNSRVFPC